MAFSLLEKVASGLNHLFKQTSQVVTWTGAVGWNDGSGMYTQRNYVFSPQATKSGNAINGKNALAISAFFGAVRMIAEDIGKLQLDIFTEDSDGNPVKVNRQHPLFRVLSMSPDGIHTSQQFFETLLAWALIWGNGYAIIDWMDEAKTIVRSLQMVHPNRVTINKVNGIVTYSVSADGDDKDNPNQSKVNVDSSDMFRIRGVGDEDAPFPIANFARESLGITLATQTLQSNMFSNGINIGGVLQTDQVLEPEHRKGIANEYMMEFGGVNNWGKVAVLDAGMQYVPNNSLKSTDAELLETRKFQVEEVARWLRIPLHKLGILESNATFNNIEQENIKYNSETLGAWMKRIIFEVDMKLLKFDPSITVQYDMKPLTMTDTESRAKFWNDLIDSGIATPNDAIADLGLKTYPEGDTHYISNNVQPVNDRINEQDEEEPESTGLSDAEQSVLDFTTLKAKFDSYGVGVRAGALTPQTVDEDAFREEAGLPVMGSDVKEAWEEDGGVRRPITLKSQSEFEATADATVEEAETPEEESEEQAETAPPEEQESTTQLDPLNDILGRYQQLMIKPVQMIINRQIKHDEAIDQKKDFLQDDYKHDEKKEANFIACLNDSLMEVLQPFATDLQMEIPEGLINKWVVYKGENWQKEKAFFIANDLLKHYLQVQNLPVGLYNFEKPDGSTCFVQIDSKGVISELQN